MRLSPTYHQWIKKLTKEYFGKDAKVYLFGSRADNEKKGGDIDLYIETSLKGAVFEKKIKMLAALKRNLGEQKIDIVINNFMSDLYIYKIAKREGILL